MEYAQILISLALVDLLAVATPGPNFMLVSQVATSASRSRALWVVAGLLAANLGWCLAAILGLGLVFAASPLLHTVAQVGGAAYLIYLAVGLWRAAPLPVSVASADIASSVNGIDGRRGHGFWRGCFVGMSNPKSLAYFSSVFTVFLPASSSPALQASALAVVALNTVVWYGAVAMLLSVPRVQQGFLRWQRVFNRVAGAMLGAFGLRLLLAKSES